jgi:hypothetical protein
VRSAAAIDVVGRSARRVSGIGVTGQRASGRRQEPIDGGAASAAFAG